MPTSERQGLAQAQLMIRQGDAQEALKALRQMEPSVQAAGAHSLFQGQAAYQAGDFAAAAEHFERVPEQNPLRESWQALVEAKRGNLAEAIRSLGKKGPIPYSSILVEFAIVIEGALLDDPRRRPATDLDLRIVREMAEGDLSHAPRGKSLSWRTLSRAWVNRDHETLLGFAAKLMHSQPREPDGRHVLVHLLLECGLTKEASALSAKLNEEFPDVAPLLSQQGKVAVSAGDLRLALTALRAVHVEGPEDYCCHWHLGTAAVAAGNLAEARKFYGKALNAYFIGNFEECWLPLWSTACSEHFLSHA